MKTEIIHNRKGFLSLATDWRNLPASIRNPLFSFHWYLSCMEAFHSWEDVRVVTVRDKERLVGVAPLVLHSKSRVGTLEFIGASHLFEPCDLLFTDETVRHHLVAGIMNMGLAAQLRNICRPREDVSELGACFRAGGLVISRTLAPTPYRTVLSSWEEFMGTLSANRRYDLKRKRAMTKKHGSLAMEVIAPDPAGLDGLLSEVFDIEGSGWKTRSGSAINSKAAMEKFLRHYCREACRQGILRLFFLKVASDRIAVQVCLQAAGSIWVLKMGYREEWARCSPGIQLTAETIRYAHDQELYSYEFLGVAEPWTRSFTDQYHANSLLLYYPRTARGMIGLGRDLTRSLAQKVSNPVLAACF